MARSKQRGAQKARGDGSIYPEGTGFRVTVYINQRPIKRRAATREAAEAVRAELLQLKEETEKSQVPVETLIEELNALRGAGIDVRAGMQTVEEWLIIWQEAKSRSLSPRSRQNNKIYIEGYLIPLLGDKALGGITAEEIQAALNRAQDDIIKAWTDEETGEVRFTGERTIKALAQVLNAAFKMAVKRRMIRYNPMEGVELPQYRRKVPPPLADEHLIAFLTAADQHPLAPLWWLYGLLGLRRGEGLGVRWCDLDLTRGTVHIRQQIQHLGSKLERGAPKNTGIRILPLPAPVVERLQIHRQALMELHIRYSATWNEEDLVFVTRDGRPWWPSNLTTEFHLIARGVPLPDTATLHGLRHTISTLLAECEANEAIIAAFLGHQKKTVTLQYTHARIEAMRKSQDAVMLRLFPNGAPRWKEE